MDLIKDKQFLKDIKQANKTCRITTNGGTVLSNKKGPLPGYGEVWYHLKGLTNLLSLHNVKQEFKVTYYSGEEDCFTVHHYRG